MRMIVQHVIHADVVVQHVIHADVLNYFPHKYSNAVVFMRKIVQHVSMACVYKDGI